MATHPYLHFQGTCAAALTHYAEVFAGTGLQMMTYAQMPEAPPAYAGSSRIMHGQVTIGAGTLMASDFPPGTEGDPQKAASVMQTAPDLDTARRWFDALMQGGDLIDPFGPTFFSPGFGMVRDKFGTHWIIAAEPA